MQLELGKKKQLLLVGSIFLFIIISSSFFFERKIEKDNIFLTELLRSEYSKAVIKSETIDIIDGLPQVDHLNAIEQNQTLRQGWYQAIHRVNPLYALPGTDIEILKETVFKLEEAMREASSYAKNLQEKDIAEHLHPFGFLQKLFELEQHRREMLAQPNETRIQQYHLALLSAISSYQKEIDRYRRILSTISVYPPLVFFYQESSKSSFEETLEKLRRESESVFKEEERRFKCYRGLMDFCSEILHPILETESVPNKKLGVTSDEIFSFLRKWYDPTFIKNPFHKTESVPETIKTIVMDVAHCFPEIPSSFLHIELKNTEYNLTAAKTESLSNLFFYRIKTEDLESPGKYQGHQKYLASLVAGGHNTQYQPFNLYTCPESGYDESRALSVIEMYSLVEKHPLGARINGDTGQKLHVLEKQFIATDYLSDHVVKNYIAQLSKTIAEKNFRTEMLEGGKKDLLQEAEERIVLWQSQTAQYEKTIIYALTLNRPLLFYIRDHDIPPSGLFMPRSYPSVFFLPFNQTISKQAVSFSEKTKPVWEKEQRFREVVPFISGSRYKKTINELLENARLEEIFIQKMRDESETIKSYVPIEISLRLKEKLGM